MLALELAQSLIKIKSVSPNDEGCFDLIEAQLIPLRDAIERNTNWRCIHCDIPDWDVGLRIGFTPVFRRWNNIGSVSYTHLRAHETPEHRGWAGGGD